MKYLYIFIALSILFTSDVSAQFDDQFEDLLEQLLLDLQDVVNPVGLSVSVRSADDVWNGTIGVSSESDTLTSTSLFAMGSVTKTFISAGILKLMEDDSLSLNDPIHFYLPVYRNIDSTILIKELLNHTSGVYNSVTHPLFDEVIFDDANQYYTFSAEEVLQLFVLEPVFERGTSQEYSNTNYILLGMIISEVMNKPFDDALFSMFNIQDKYPSIFNAAAPLSSTALVDLWYDIGSGLENITELQIGLDGMFSAVGAAGSFATSAADLSQWGYDLYSGKLLKEDTMDSLFNYCPYLVDGLSQYGLGVFNISLPCELAAVGHGGNILYETHLTYVEEFDLSVALMTNDEITFMEIGGLPSVTEEIYCRWKDLLITSNDDMIPTSDVTIYPNPTFESVYLELNSSLQGELRVDVFNEVGSLVLSDHIINNNSRPVELKQFIDLTPGMYIVKISDVQNTYTEIVLKQ